MRLKIEETLSNDNRYVFGWADLSPCIPARFSETPFALSIGREIEPAIVQSACNGPTREYFIQYHELNEELSRMVQIAAQEMRSSGARLILVEPTVHEAQIDDEMRKSLRYCFSHKMAATRAGLGWIGKTDLFVSKKFGPRLRLATVLSDRPFGEIGTPIEKNFCSSCARCVEACPAKAAKGIGWHAGLERDEFFNAHLCRDMCRKLSMERLGEHISLCGICVAACPVGKG